MSHSLALKEWQQEHVLGFSFWLETHNGLLQLSKMLQDETVHLNLDNFREKEILKLLF